MQLTQRKGSTIADGVSFQLMHHAGGKLQLRAWWRPTDEVKEPVNDQLLRTAGESIRTQNET